ncbi:MAG: hypothetical protein MZV64_33475 [Ignavibacteriales bacterium]|nr:hypothetical protein [Ignavibacteriales bacterium]
MSPTRPPIPARGLTISPMRFMACPGSLRERPPVETDRRDRARQRHPRRMRRPLIVSFFNFL